MRRGKKELSVDECKVVVQLKEHFDQERKSAQTVSTRDSFGRTAVALGIGVASVKRIVGRHKRTGTVLAPPRRKRGRQVDETCQNAQVAVRNFVRSKNLVGQRVSVEEVRRHLSDGHDIKVDRSTLWRGLKRWGFTFGEGRRRESLKEQDYVIHNRRAYLRQIRANRNPDGTCKRPEVYLDETYINKNHFQRLTWYMDEDGPWVNKPSGVGPRLIVVHAVTHGGWVDGAQLVFEAKKRTGDYHGQMNWENFSRWFTEQLLSNIPKNSLIILDNACYHNVLVRERFPASASKKDELREWLTRNGYPWRDDMLRSELYEECVKHAPVPEFRLDPLAAAARHKILRTPQSHPELQPIEICWAVVKNHMTDNCDFTMTGLGNHLPEAFAKVTGTTCAKIIAEVRAKEDEYWENDELLDAATEFDAQEEVLSETVNET